MEKNPLKVEKSDFFLKKKIKIPTGSRLFFNHERSEAPPAGLARSVLKPCAETTREPPASLSRSMLKPCVPKPYVVKYPRLVLHVLC